MLWFIPAVLIDSWLCRHFLNVDLHIAICSKWIYVNKRQYCWKPPDYQTFFSVYNLAQSAGAVEYTDCFSAKGVRPLTNECPEYDTKQSVGEIPVMLGLWGMRSTPLLPSFPGLLWPGVVAPNMCPLYGINRTKPCFLHYSDFCI